MLTRTLFWKKFRKQYVVTARAKGLDERQVLWKHVFPQRLDSIITGFRPPSSVHFFTGFAC